MDSQTDIQTDGGLMISLPPPDVSLFSGPDSFAGAHFDLLSRVRASS